MTDPTTPLTDESEALLAEVHGTQMALTVFPARLRAIEAAAARRALEGSGVVEALESIRDYQPTEVTYDDFAYARMVKSYQRAARQALAALPRPEEPRVERCTWCGTPIAEHPLTDACAIAQESEAR